MKCHILYLFLPFLVILSSCKQNDREKISSEFKRSVQEYSSSDIQKAKTALIYHCETLERWKKEGVKMDYDQALAVANARLFVLESALNNKEKADDYFSSCTNHLIQGRLKRSYPSKVYTKAEILEIVNQTDKDFDVLWKSRHPVINHTNSGTKSHQMGSQ